SDFGAKDFGEGGLCVRTLTCWLIAALISGCSNGTQTTQKPPEPVIDVGWTVLVRDYATARTYTNTRVRFLLHEKEYESRGNELHGWVNDRMVPPTIVIRLPEAMTVKGTVLVTGTCREPVRDEIWRSRRVNFFMVVENATIR